MTEYAQLAAELVEGFERGEFDAWDRHAAAPKKNASMLQAWWPNLDGMIGQTRRVTQPTQIGDAPAVARVVLSGETDEAVVTILFDDDGKVTDIGVTDWPLQLGIGNVQIDVPGGTALEHAQLYGALLGIPVPPAHEPNWIVLTKDRHTKPVIFIAGQAPNWRAPAWNDPDRQQQMHLELLASDVQRAIGVAESSGAIRVDDDVWTDPAGHAIRLLDGDSGDAPAVIGRIVLDTDDPASLAAFYDELLGPHAETLAYRHVDAHTPPRWPDPEYPQQMHMDLKFEDYYGAMRTAERLGATRLPPATPWSHPDVYADLAGHPFCLCFPGQ